MDFGIMFFTSAGREHCDNNYRLLLDAARYADEHGFCCVWTPERHFHEFGGLFPNPAVTSAALATITRRIQLRAGSLISPLHDPIRVAEEWSMVDNLSGGRAAVSFGSGWNVNDFVFFPERYDERQAVMYRQIEEIQKLWRGESLIRRNSFGKETRLTIYPKPVQKSLPIWITSSGNAKTFASAGAVGANLLTHLIGQDIDTLAEKIQLYRKSLADHGFDPRRGKVSLMLHTYMDQDAAAVKAKVREPFREYLRSAVSLELKAAQGGGAISGGHQIDSHDIETRDMEDLLDVAFERYFRTGALMGTPEDREPLIRRLEEIEVDEAACLIDFLDDAPGILKSLEYVNQLSNLFSPETREQEIRGALNNFIEDLESE